MINIGQISTKLSEIPIEEISYCTQFTVHKDSELTGMGFVSGFFMMFSQGQNTLNEWVEHISVSLNRVFSATALQAKLQYRHIGFVKAILSYILSQSICEQIKGIKSPVLETFSRVFVEDSTCIGLPSNLSEDFGGAHSKQGKTATARIQCLIELKSGRESHIEVQSFRDNDLQYAPQILSIVKKGDLIIRDLGYWNLQVFAMLNLIGAFFLSRLKTPLNLYELQGDKNDVKKIDLVDFLHQADLKGQTFIDKKLLLGAEEKQAFRVIFIKVPPPVEQQRRRKANKNRDKRHTYSKQYFVLLGWTILVTNIEHATLTPQQLMLVYSLRWRIEIFFKAWKSNFHFEEIFKSKQSLTPPRAIITLYLVLIWISLFFVPLFNFFLSEIYHRFHKFISLLRFAKFVVNHFLALAVNPKDDFYVRLAAITCCYDKKKNQTNFYQKFSLFEYPLFN
jgi:hypothetical protein